jgi:hypothetical protein
MGAFFGSSYIFVGYDSSKKQRLSSSGDKILSIVPSRASQTRICRNLHMVHIYVILRLKGGNIVVDRKPQVASMSDSCRCCDTLRQAMSDHHELRHLEFPTSTSPFNCSRNKNLTSNFHLIFRRPTCLWEISTLKFEAFVSFHRVDVPEWLSGMTRNPVCYARSSLNLAIDNLAIHNPSRIETSRSLTQKGETTVPHICMVYDLGNFSHLRRCISYQLFVPEFRISPWCWQPLCNSCIWHKYPSNGALGMARF